MPDTALVILNAFTFCGELWTISLAVSCHMHVYEHMHKKGIYSEVL